VTKERLLLQLTGGDRRSDPKLRGAIVKQLSELTCNGSPAIKSRGIKLLARLKSPPRTLQSP
jgi:hypothetical protein